MNRVEAWLIEYMTVRRWIFVVAGAAIATFGCGIMLELIQRPHELPVQHVQIDLPPGTPFQNAMGDMIMSQMHNSSGIANETKSASQLHQIGLAILMYQNDNTQKMPPNFNVLSKTEMLSPSTLVSPVSGEPYEYALKGDHTPTDNEVVAYEVGKDLHRINILFGDGHAESFPPDDANAIISAGHLPAKN